MTDQASQNKPRFYNYALAHTCDFSTIGGAIGAWWLLFHELSSANAFLATGFGVIWVAITAILAGAIGYLIGLFFIWPLVGSIASKLQGAPFHRGDRVWILAGRYKGIVTHVYEVWDERGQVRVRLGADGEHSFDDVLCTVSICRV